MELGAQHVEPAVLRGRRAPPRQHTHQRRGEVDPECVEGGRRDAGPKLRAGFMLMPESGPSTMM